MQKLSFIIPSAPSRDHNEILNNLRDLHLKHFTGQYVFEIFLIKGTWPSAQRNIGIAQATGDLMYFFDDDIIIPKEAIERPIPHFEDAIIHGVGGPNLTPPENSFIQHCFGYILSSHFIFADNACRYAPIGPLRQADENKLISCNFVLRHSTAKAHPYNEKMFHNEENEWFGRIIRSGGKLLYDPEFFIYHHRRETLSKFLRQIFNWGHGRGEHIVITPKHFKFSFLVPTFFLTYIIALIFYHTWWALLPLALYVILDIGFTIQVAIKHKSFKSILVLPWLIPATHLAYGLGLPMGLLRRLIKPRHIPNYNPEKFEVIKVELS